MDIPVGNRLARLCKVCQKAPIYRPSRSDCYDDDDYLFESSHYWDISLCPEHLCIFDAAWEEDYGSDGGFVEQLEIDTAEYEEKYCDPLNRGYDSRYTNKKKSTARPAGWKWLVEEYEE